MPQTVKQKIGDLGENIAVKHFVKHFFGILDRNYRKKWGEIDIVAKKDGILHFIEVKTIRNLPENAENNYKPEENVHFWKRQRLARIIQTYLLDKKVSCETEWQADVATVFLDFKTRRARIKIIENVIL
jgi:putative endonuclease